MYNILSFRDVSNILDPIILIRELNIYLTASPRKKKISLVI